MGKSKPKMACFFNLQEAVKNLVSLESESF